MSYLLTIVNDDGDVILQESVDELTNDQVGSVCAMFTERERGDVSGPATVAE